MSKIQQVLLDDVVEIIGGGTPSRDNPEYYNGSIPWFTVKDFGENLFLTRSQEAITEKGLRKSASNLIPKGNVILVTRMAVGKVAINKIDIAINQDLKALKCKPSLDPKYLLFFLLSQKETLESQADGATVKGITLDSVKELKIPLPPLEEQKRIARIAGKCDRLRRTRRYTQQLSETYLQSVFLEMFGDPVKNPKKWQLITLDDVLLSAKDGPHVSPTYADSGIPFLSTRNIRPGKVIWEDLKFISHEDAAIFWKKDKPKKGDILYTKGGTTGYAKVIDFDREIAVWVHVAILKVKQDLIDPLWLENMLNSNYCYKQSQELTFGIVNRDLGLQRMPKIKMYLPPLPLQEKFTQIVQCFERLRAQQRESDRQAEHLFQSILHRAFQGEL
jgi:type I restriction enzyme, S subunit